MEFHPVTVTDTAAKQAIDATRAYKEWVRVQRQLKTLGGSMFWKPVGSYEYLAQRSGLKIHHLGARSPETELQYEKFQQERDRLRSREKSLHARIKLHERMNHAVHSGSAPTPLLKTLDALEEAGAGTGSLVLGSAALLAYWQASGLQQPIQATKALDEGLWVLLREKLTAQAKRKLQSSKIFNVSEVQVKDSRFLKFLMHSNQVKHVSCIKSTKTPMTSLPPASALEEALVPVLAQIKSSPAFEQVVIGKTGKMGLMRTVDPKVFLDLCDTPAGKALGIEPQLGEMVQQLVSQRRIHSKIQDDVSTELKPSTSMKP